MRGKRGRGRRNDDVWGGHGGYMGMKKEKLVNQFSEQSTSEAKKDGIFCGVAIFVNGWTNPTADELKRIMMQHGGVFHHYYNSRKTTHIIASNLPDVKVRQLKGHELIVKPEWIVECVAQGRLVDYKPFLYFTHQSKNQPTINFQSVAKTNQDSENSVSDENEFNKKYEEIKNSAQLENASSLDIKEDSSEALCKDNKSAAVSSNDDLETVHLGDSLELNERPSSPFAKDVSICDINKTLTDGSSTSDRPACQSGKNEVSSAQFTADSSSDVVKTPGPSPSKAKDATHPSFLGEFYQNSRLHHISTMGANAKQYVTELRERNRGHPLDRSKLEPLRDSREMSSRPAGRTIMHIDMDSFFVSVGLRRRPDLRGKPVAVTHARGNKTSRGEEADKKATEIRKKELQQYRDRIAAKSGDNTEGMQTIKGMRWQLDNIDGLSSMSEIASCSYEARAAGVRNGMFLGPALQLCPTLTTIEYDFPAYEEVSKILYDTVASYTLEIQAVSCDEMFVDLTDLLNSLNMDTMRFISHLREEIKTKTNCPCSVGLGPNIFLARIATKKAKPNGQYYLDQESAQEHLAEMKVSDLPGVGRSMERKLNQLGVATCGDLQQYTLGQLQGHLGNKTGQQLFNFARGIDSRSLELEQVRKTVSAEVNYGIRFSGWGEADQFVRQLADEVSGRLRKLHTRGRCITLKLMARSKDAPEETSKFLGHGVCDNMSRSVQLTEFSDQPETIFKQAFSMLKALEVEPKDMRGLGISISKLEEKRGSSSNNSILKFMKHQSAGLPTDERKVEKSGNAATSIGRSTGSPACSPTKHQPRDHEARSLTATAGFSVECLDREVLAALPEDIRNEVLAEYGGDSSSRDSWPRQEDDSANPGPSTSASELKAEDIDRTRRRSSAGGPINIGDLSFSQIDPSVLDQLPSHLQSEIRSHFNQKKVLSSPAKLKLDSSLSSRETQPTSPRPVRGRRRGRPPKHLSLGRSDQPPAKRPKVKNNDIREKPKTNLHSSGLIAGEICDEATNSCDGIEQNPKTPSEPAFIPEVQQKPSFCGRTEIHEIRPLVKEWLRSTKRPLREDIELMTDFLEGLVNIWRLDMVLIMLKCIFRNIEKLDDPDNWKSSWSQLLDTVQTKVIQSYGYPLEFKDTYSV